MGFQNNANVEAKDIRDGFEPFPEGPYAAYLFEVEVGEFKNEKSKNYGKPRMVATLKIAEGPYKGRQLKDFAIPLFTEEGNDWANRKAKEFFVTGLGLEGFDDIPDDLTDLQGESVNISVGIEPDSRDEDVLRNVIKRYLSQDAKVTNGEDVIKEPVKKKAPKPSGKL